MTWYQGWLVVGFLASFCLGIEAHYRYCRWAVRKLAHDHPELLEAIGDAVEEDRS